MLDWDHLRSFLAIARTGSLTGAAKVLKVRQSTMGRRLEALQAASGARLFAKTPRGFVLTAAGEAILGHIQHMETEALAAERLISGQDIRLEGRVRLTTVESLATEVLMPLFASFQATYPGITLELVTDTRSLSLTKREADVALRIARLEQNDVAMRKVGEMTYGLYASAGYLAARGTPDFAQGAMGYAIITTDDDLANLPEMRFLRSIAPQAAVALRGNSRYLHRNAASAGIGIACLARYLGDSCPGLVRLTLPAGAVEPRRDLWLAVHNDLRHTPRIRALTDHLTLGLRQAAPVLAPA